LTKANSSRAKPPPLFRPMRPAGLLGPSVLIPIYILLLVIGDITFQRANVSAKGNELSRPVFLFLVVNASTLTGFQQAHRINDLTDLGQELVFGLIITGILFTLIAGGTAVLRIARLPHSDFQLVTWAIAAIIFLCLLGPTIHLGDTILSSMFAAISAFGNSGLYIGQLPTTDDATTHLLLLPLAVIGGLGLPVLMDLFDRLRNKSTLSDHSWTVLTWSAAIYIVAMLLLFVMQLPPMKSPPHLWLQAIEKASTQAINSRSAGFPFQFATYWPRTVQWTIIALMIIGAASAGTAGGIKLNTLAVLARGTIDTLSGRPATRALGIALTWTAVYTAMLTITMMLLLITEPQMAADRLLFLAASALSNVGLSHDPLTVSDAGLYVLSVTMLAGRIAPVLILWWMVETTTAAEIAVG
jgi:Trk-type K+ transport system membrane component